MSASRVDAAKIEDFLRCAVVATHCQHQGFAAWMDEEGLTDPDGGHTAMTLARAVRDFDHLRGGDGYCLDSSAMRWLHRNSIKNQQAMRQL